MTFRSMGFTGVVTFAVLLAGCTSDEGTQNGLGGIDLPEGTALLEGHVLDTEFSPVEGANVRAGDLVSAPTDEAGTFRLAGVPAGRHIVAVTAPGYLDAAETLDVVGDRRYALEFNLERLPSTGAYVEHLTFTGFEACGWFLGVTGATGETMSNTYGAPCLFGTPSTSFPVNVSETWRYLVMEMEWQTLDNMWFLATHQAGVCGTDGDSVCWGQAMGRSPLRIEGAPESVDHARKYALDGMKTFPNGSFDLVADTVYVGLLRDEVNSTAGPQCVTAIQTALAPLGQSWNSNLGCGLGYGYSTGYPFDYYISIFHNARPQDPASYTGLPDA